MPLRHSTLLVIALVIAVGTVPVIVAADVTLTDTSRYSGGEENADQAIVTTVTLSPEGSRITDVTIRIESTDRGFIDFDSFSKEVDPADSNVTVRSTEREGEFRINELEPGETVNITFQSYPTTIKRTTLDVATVDVEYVQNGQQLSASETVNADLSSSPWFKYQNARGGSNSPFLLGGAVVLGVVVGAVIAVFGTRRGDTESAKKEDDTTGLEEFEQND